jgi:hypothetical protein
MPLYLDSVIFHKPEAEQAISNMLTRVAKKYKVVVVERMIEGPQTGRIYSKGNGPGFRLYHQASARYQRPAVDTGNLINSVEDEKIGPYEHQVYVDDGLAPYGKYLQSPRLERPIMTEEDAYDYERSQIVDEEIFAVEEALS